MPVRLLAVDVMSIVTLTSCQLPPATCTLFTRIVPTLKDVGLWGPKIQKAFVDMGVIDYSQVDVEALMADDESRAAEIDRQRVAQVEQTIEAGSAA